ncbi:flagellar motor protein MotB [Rhodoferax antarcticus]|uniref:Motility protein B with OmpA domain n=1 Tax=Rhodoferax antarcticus ANT.BR TaxID=1111071 RepID=A0A1Q8YGH6_9BURK|nr:flagellar motor protein MotB [Rhodoferax antarcticus]APW45608.1 flagellar motor protein MotB [Rhodoferax antarcticus]OLP07095.1 motility protein B with OmpA domain [Rhodoferax antarcticus ANT.BR]
MATEAKKLQPIIIKRIKKTAHVAHGGAWKIAYADFVTAMMAFFLLMWLLGSTSEGDKKGLSDYFQSPLKVAMQGGSGAGASQSLVNAGGNDLTQTAGQSKRGDGSDPQARRLSGNQDKVARARKDAQKIAELSAKISSLISQNPKLAEFSEQIKLKVTPDGLQIQIVDDQKRPMFDSGSASVKPYMHDILMQIGSALSDVDNKISLEGHTDQTPYSNQARGYSNWELSADRANATRRELVAAGMPNDKMARVMGLASSVLLDEENPRSASNRRISITILTREAEERLLGARKVEAPAEAEAPPSTPPVDVSAKP